MYLPVGLCIKSHSQDTTRASFNNWRKNAEQLYRHFRIKHGRKFSWGSVCHTVSQTVLWGLLCIPESRCRIERAQPWEKMVLKTHRLSLCSATRTKANGSKFVTGSCVTNTNNHPRSRTRGSKAAGGQVQHNISRQPQHRSPSQHEEHRVSHCGLLCSGENHHQQGQENQLNSDAKGSSSDSMRDGTRPLVQESKGQTGLG